MSKMVKERCAFVREWWICVAGCLYAVHKHHSSFSRGRRLPCPSTTWVYSAWPRQLSRCMSVCVCLYVVSRRCLGTNVIHV